MAENTHDRHNQDERPFLASEENHEAQLMQDKKGSSAETEMDHSPAPMLPLIHHEDTPNLSVADAATSVAPTMTTESQVNTQSQSDTSIVAFSAQPSSGEQDLTLISHYPSSKKALISLGVATLFLSGFSAVWYSMNQNVYTLGNQNQSQIANQAHNKTKPATLGAETNQGKTIVMKVKNLPALEQGHYQLWIEQSGKVSSLGMFTLEDTGKIVDIEGKDFQPHTNITDTQAKIFVTIEADDQPAQQPSKSIILSGSLKNGAAELAFTAIDLTQAKGVFTLATPTDDSGEHKTSGIWLAKSEGESLSSAGISAPKAPAGWTYEAQVKFKDQVVAIGRFTDPNAKDNLSIFTPNADKAPNFPGEDYLQGAPTRLGLSFPTNLGSGEWKVIISIEPDQDGEDPSGDGLFFLQPFTADIPKDAAAYKPYEFKVDTSNFPSARISLQ